MTSSSALKNLLIRLQTNFTLLLKVIRVSKVEVEANLLIDVEKWSR